LHHKSFVHSYSCSIVQAEKLKKLFFVIFLIHLASLAHSSHTFFVGCFLTEFLLPWSGVKPKLPG